MTNGRTLGASVWLAVSLAITAASCSREHSAARPLPRAAGSAQPQRETVPTAANGTSSVPFDLGAVMRQVHFAFREEHGRWRGGDASYAVDATPQSFSVTPRMGDEPGHREGPAVAFTTTAVTRGGTTLAFGPATAGIAEDGHLEIDRGAVVESLHNGDQGVEQSWGFETQPEGHGDLEVHIEVRGARFDSETAGGLHFRDASGPLGVRYGHATWIDARGARADVRARWDGTSVVLRVPANVVDTAVYPCVLDPTIGPEFATDTPIPVGNVWEQTQPAIATGGSQWLVVWEDSRSLRPGIYGARVSSTGAVLDPYGISIATSTLRLLAPSVAFNGTTWLVAWEGDQTSPPLDKNIYGARVTTAGVVQDTTPLNIATGGYDQQLPAVSSDGSQWLVVWQDHFSGSGTGSSFDIRGSLLSAAGAITATFNVDTGYADQLHPAVAYNGTDWLVAWEDQRAGNAVIYYTRVTRTGTVTDSFGSPMPGTGSTQANPSIASNGSNWLVAWDEYHAASSYDVVGARISAAGALLDVSEIAITNATGSQTDPGLSFDGTNYVAAWSDQRTDSYGDIYGARVSPAGTVLDPSGVAICTVTQLQRWPALDFNGSQALVVWADNRYANYRDVYGARIDGGITVIDTVSFAISTSANPQYTPAVAFNGTNYLIAWQDRRHDLDYDIYGVRVTRTGTVLDPSGIAISTAVNRQAYPDVASDGTNWLVVWGDDRTTGNPDLYGARVSSSGAVLDPTGFAISNATNGQNLPAVAFDGTNYFVVWNDGRGGTFTDIYGARVTTAGTVLDATGIPICTAADYQSGPDIAFNGTNYYVVWMDHRSTSRYDLYGSRVSPAGAVLDGTGLAISAGSGNKSSPAISSDGNQWLAVWYQDRSIGGPDIYGQRIAPTGTLSGSALAISATVDDQYFPDVAFDGTNWIVVWRDSRGGNLGNLYSSRVSAGGFVQDPAGVVLASTTTLIDAPVITRGVGSEMLLAYERYDETEGYVERVFGRTLVWGGDPGAVCGSSGDCTSGNCVDGVCCTTACGGGATDDCMACSVAMGAASNGTCGPVTAARVCRTAVAGGCDVPETCDGTALTCPTDGFAPSTQTCRPSAGMCDVAEMCTGSSPACPADGFAPSTQSCRASAGMCDVAETCTGSSAACPMDGFAPSTQTCRASAGMCDVAETCTGTSAACPMDGFAPSTQACRPSAGMCDVAETCTGSSAACPMDGFAPSTQTCRPSAGMCDVAETCTGSSASCPMDGFAPSTQTCRASAGACDIAEACTGSSAACPMDALQPNGTACGDSLTCNGAETCSMGACVMGTAPDCDDSDVCTTDSCGEPAGCAHAAIPGCCHTAVECTDSDACTDDSCIANVCVHVPVSGCGVDAGPEDVVDVIDAADADDVNTEDAVDAVDADDASSAPDAIDVAVDVQADTGADVGVDTGSDARDVAMADVVDVVAADTGDDAGVTDASRDGRGDAVDEGTAPPRGCACRTSQTGRADGGAIALAALLGAAMTMTGRRRRQRARQNDAR